MAVTLQPRGAAHPPAPAPATPIPAARAAGAFGPTDALLLLMALIWGINFSVVKFGTGIVAPLAYNAVRVVIAAVVLLGLAALAREAWPRGRDLRRLALLGVLGNGVYQVLFIEGVARTRAGSAALILAAGPAIIAVIGRLRGSERLRARGAFGIALSMAGVGLVLLGNARRAPVPGEAPLLGALLILGGALCWATYTVYLQPYTHTVGPRALAGVTMGAGAIPLLVFSAPALVATDWAGVSVAGWGAMAYSGLFALVVAYLIWNRGVRTLGPTRTAIYANLQPAIALLVAWGTLGEVPTVWQGLGMAAIITGVVLTRR